jgi:hypothetical protein
MVNPRASAELEALNQQYAAALRAQIDEALREAEVKRREADEAAAYAHSLQDALRSVEALQHLQSPERVQVFDRRRELEDGTRGSTSSVTISAVGEIIVPPPPKIAPYVPTVGGKRLKSKRMIFDLLKMIEKPVTRDQLRRMFFEYYGRKDLERYWIRPDNALNTAIDRAVRDHYAEAITREDGQTWYTAGWIDAETGQPAFEDDEDDD